jgi:hypothetical protein
MPKTGRLRISDVFGVGNQIRAGKRECLVSFLRKSLTRPDWPVDTKEIVLERANSDLIDYVVVNFEKHSAPRFQIHFGRRRNTVDNEFIRSGNLVKNPHEYYHFWGKPAWLPTRFWSDNSAQRVVSTVTSMVDEIIAFIEFGEKGENISIHFWASTSLGAP